MTDSELIRNFIKDFLNPDLYVKEFDAIWEGRKIVRLCKIFSENIGILSIFEIKIQETHASVTGETMFGFHITSSFKAPVRRNIKIWPDGKIT